MTVTRRRVLFAGLGAGAAAGGYCLSNAHQTLPPGSRGRGEVPPAPGRIARPQRRRRAIAFLSDRRAAAGTHVLEAGSGPPVLMIHGGNSVACSFEPLLTALARDFHVYAPDRPGCGLTGQFLYRGVDLRRHAVSFVNSLMDTLRLDRAAIVGNSMGGYFGLVFALAHPERVSRLVLMGEPAGASARVDWNHTLIGLRGVNSILYATVLKPGLRSVRSSFEKFLVAGVRRVPADYLECLAATAVIPGAKESWLTMVESVTRWDRASTLTYALRPELAGLQPPALLLWGEKGAFGPPARGEEMVRLAPRALLVALPDAGHLPWLDQPGRCLELIRSFLAGE